MKPEEQTTQGRQFDEISSTRKCEFSTTFRTKTRSLLVVQRYLDCAITDDLMFSILVSGLKDLKVSSITLFHLVVYRLLDCTLGFLGDRVRTAGLRFHQLWPNLVF